MRYALFLLVPEISANIPSLERCTFLAITDQKPYLQTMFIFNDRKSTWGKNALSLLCGEFL